MNAKLKAAGLLAGASIAAALYLSAGVNAEDAESGIRLLNRAGAVLDVGSKRAVAYYVKDANACQVSVIVSETYPEQIPFNIASVRFSTTVQAGTSTEVATSDGSGLSLSCAKNANMLQVQSLDNVAWVATN